jgi:peptidyl-prolyl cis-trans isomerase C
MIRAFVLVTIGILLGIGTGEYLTSNFLVRRWIGQVVRRGDLQVLVGHRGIYDTDAERAWQSELFATGANPQEIEASIAAGQKRAALGRLVEEQKLNLAAAGESIDPRSTRREMELLRAQFPDEKTWRQALAGAGLTERALWRETVTGLRDLHWVETKIGRQIQPNEDEVRRYYEEHRAVFQEPLRLRASHLFLAAPEGYPKEVIETKRALIEQLSQRLTHGESFPALVAEFSEDEATKKRGGDLGYFAEERMLPKVFATAQQLHPGEISAPVRSRLGLHILRLTESLPSREQTFAEARPEIDALLKNRQRADAVAATIAALR